MGAYANYDLKDTIVALATPPGQGAIGVIRVSGRNTFSLVNKVFKGKDLSKQSSHTVHLGSIMDVNDTVIDEVLVTLFIAPRSYTGEHVIEISCHGSNYIIQQILALIVKQGARLAQPGEFTLRAFLNGKMDLSQAEAVSDLIAAESKSAHDLAIQQMRGGFSKSIQQLRQELIDFASLIELELDFGEEDVEFANRDHLKELVQKIQRLIKGLLDSFQLGNVIKKGVQTVIAGRPNAGKSTLLNALLNEERAIVSDIAGTTRDTIEETLNIKGVTFRLIDTAGIREAADQIEAIGVEKTMEKIDQSSLLVYVFDVIQMQPNDVREDLQKLKRPNQHLLLVANKMDLNPYTKFEHYFPEGAVVDSENHEFDDATDNLPTSPNLPNPQFPIPKTQPLKPNPQNLKPKTQNLNPNPQNQQINKSTITKWSWVPVSAINQMNIEYLKEKLYESVVEQEVGNDTSIVSNARHFEALDQAQASLSAVLEGLSNGVTSDFVALDIRQALYYLGLITGEVTTDDLLGNIFGKFCIGK